ncbi:MAG: HIT family protein [Hyphomicrobiaceae bacterium]|nr:HIT family protein [Hyphomicrobiaceae bacterium]
MPSYDPDNIFAKILAGDIPSVKVFENDDCIAIMDVFPQTEGHCLVIPRAPSRNILDADPASLAATVPHVQKLAKAVKSALGADGIRVMQFNETPSGQTVFHLHWHVMPIYEGQSLGAHAGGGMADTAKLEVLAEKIRAAL